MLSKQKLFTLGLQHVLAMYAGAVIVPLIIGGALKLSPAQLAYLVAADMFTCGLATLLQVLGNKYFGVKLPVVLGCTFTAVGPIISIGLSSNLATAYGSIIISGICVFLLAPLFGKLLRFFPTVVTGSVVTVIGLSLIPVAMNNAAGGQGAPDYGQAHNLLLALGTLVLILLINRLFDGFVRAISVLIGLIAGTIAASFMGMVHFTAVSQASWVNIEHPFYFGKPEFNLSAIITMLLVCIVSMVESTGVYFAVSKVTGVELTKNMIVKGLRAEGIAVLLGGLLNAFPYTTFSQNVGLLSLTRVKTRNVIVVAGGILIVLGLLPKVAALATIIPSAVLGGAMIAMFGMVVASGVNILTNVDFRRNENLLIVACSIAVGLGATAVPQMFDHLPTMAKMLCQSGIVMGSFTAILLNLLLRPDASNQPKEAVDSMAADTTATSSGKLAHQVSGQTL